MCNCSLTSYNMLGSISFSWTLPPWISFLWLHCIAMHCTVESNSGIHQIVAHASLLGDCSVYCLLKYKSLSVLQKTALYRRMCCLHCRGRIGGNKSSLTKIRKVLWPRPSYSLMTIANRWYGSYPWWWSWWWWFVNFTDSNLRQTAGIALLSPAFLPTFLAAFQIEVTLAFHVCV